MLMSIPELVEVVEFPTVLNKYNAFSTNRIVNLKRISVKIPLDFSTLLW